MYHKGQYPDYQGKSRAVKTSIKNDVKIIAQNWLISMEKSAPKGHFQRLNLTGEIPKNSISTLANNLKVHTLTQDQMFIESFLHQMENPKGILIPVGGNEDKGTPEDLGVDFLQNGILKRILHEMKGPDSRIEVITSASSVPRQVGQMYEEAFTKLGANNVGYMHIRKREQADNPLYLQRIQEADGVLFSGGDQLSLTKIMGGTSLLQLISERYRYDNFVVAGTSAGAMAMSMIMIYDGNGESGFYKDEVKMSPGFGLISDAIIDSHFMHRGRFGRLAQAVSSNPMALGIGLGENTGIVIREGQHFEVIGSGLVMIVDGHSINYTNLNDVIGGSPLSIENLRVHVLAKGNCYALKTRKFFTSSAEMLKTAHL
jgi:cyanophycinase